MMVSRELKLDCDLKPEMRYVTAAYLYIQDQFVSGGKQQIEHKNWNQYSNAEI